MLTKTIVAGAVVVFASMASAAPPAKDTNIPKVGAPDAAYARKVFLLKDGEAQVGGRLIKRVEIGKSIAVITYFNRTKDSQKPQFRFRLIDDYGLEIADFEDKWTFTSIGEGEAHKEDKSFSVKDLDQVFQFSNVSLPSDWSSPIYLVIEGSGI